MYPDSAPFSDQQDAAGQETSPETPSTYHPAPTTGLLKTAGQGELGLQPTSKGETSEGGGTPLF